MLNVSVFCCCCCWMLPYGVVLVDLSFCSQFTTIYLKEKDLVNGYASRAHQTSSSWKWTNNKWNQPRLNRMNMPKQQRKRKNTKKKTPMIQQGGKHTSFAVGSDVLKDWNNSQCKSETNKEQPKGGREHPTTHINTREALWVMNWSKMLDQKHNRRYLKWNIAEQSTRWTIVRESNHKVTK